MVAAQGFHQQGNPGLAFANQLQHHLTQVGAMITAVALRDVNHAFLRFPSAVVLTVGVETRRIQVAKPAQQAQPVDRLGGELRIQLARAIGINRIQRTPQHIVVEVRRFNPFVAVFRIAATSLLLHPQMLNPVLRIESPPVHPSG